MMTNYGEQYLHNLSQKAFNGPNMNMTYGAPAAGAVPELGNGVQKKNAVLTNLDTTANPNFVHQNGGRYNTPVDASGTGYVPPGSQGRAQGSFTPSDPSAPSNTTDAGSGSGSPSSAPSGGGAGFTSGSINPTYLGTSTGQGTDGNPLQDTSAYGGPPSSLNGNEMADKSTADQTLSMLQKNGNPNATEGTMNLGNQFSDTQPTSEIYNLPSYMGGGGYSKNPDGSQSINGVNTAGIASDIAKAQGYASGTPGSAPVQGGVANIDSITGPLHFDSTTGNWVTASGANPYDNPNTMVNSANPAQQGWLSPFLQKNALTTTPPPPGGGTQGLATPASQLRIPVSPRQ